MRVLVAFLIVVFFASLNVYNVYGELKKFPPLSEKDMAPALETPVIDTHPAARYQNEIRNYNMTIGLTGTPAGRLWAVWVSGGDSDLGYFVAARSDDKGKTWSKPQFVIDPHSESLFLQRRTLVGAIWTDPDGNVRLFFDQSMGYYDGRGGVWTSICKNPDADQPIWSQPVRIWNGATLQKPLVLANGDWLLPISLWERKMMNASGLKMEKTLFSQWDSIRGAHVFASSNKGKTWTARGFVRFPYHNFDEHMIVEKKDGTLWMLARTEVGAMQSFSSDKGKTWTKPEFAWQHTVSRFFIRRLASGNLLLIRHGGFDGKTKDRSHLTAWLSDDDGKTWKGGLLLDERKSISYPDGFQAVDGSIYISYDRDRGGAAEILMAVFTEQDVLAGKIINTTSRLKVLINKATGKKNTGK